MTSDGPARIDVSTIFRRRLELVIERSGENVSAFARAAGIDRSTLAQFLSGDDPRLPRADTLIAVARRARVSIDWLLGLSQQEATGAEIISALLQIEEHGDSFADDHFMRWLKEAEGYRIRTVPIAVPDFMKTEPVLRFEYRRAFEDASPAKFQAIQARLDYMSNPDSDVEVCVAIQALQSLADGEEKWTGLPAKDRREQMLRMAEIYAGAYPGLKVYLYDLREVYSAPFTVFGQKRAVVFLGPSYLVMNSSDHIRMFSRRFDELIRLAVVQPHEIARFMTDLAERVR